MTESLGPPSRGQRLYPTAECPRCDDLDVREVPPGVERYLDQWECLQCGYAWALPLGRVLPVSGGPL
jgi:Zn ribbon nucleic-acid-binding protein